MDFENVTSNQFYFEYLLNLLKLNQLFKHSYSTNILNQCSSLPKLGVKYTVNISYDRLKQFLVFDILTIIQKNLDRTLKAKAQLKLQIMERDFTILWFLLQHHHAALYVLHCHMILYHILYLSHAKAQTKQIFTGICS